MATTTTGKIVILKDANEQNILPKTSSLGVYMNDGKTLEELTTESVFFGENSDVIELNKPEIIEKVNNISSELDKIKDDFLNYKTHNGAITFSELGGIKNNQNFDNGPLLLEAMYYCAENKKVLILDGKFNISSNVIYDGFYPLFIQGTSPNSNTLIETTLSFNDEPTNLYFNNGATLELNKMGSVTFMGVGFSSISRESGTGILLRSFHNKFINCTFSQMNFAIKCDAGWKNWIGENQVLFCTFTKCETCYYSEEGSDSEFIGNLISGTCGVGFNGKCAGYTISLNHFYGRKSNTFDYFNTKITNNYFQETKGDYENDPCFILKGSFGCIVNDNNFELNSNEAKLNKKGLIGLYTKSGTGNIIFDGNSVHGKDMQTVTNLAFIKFIYETSKQDMPLVIGSNNLRCCEALFTENYYTYNLQGSYFAEGTGITALGGVIAEQKTVYANGTCHFWCKMSSLPAYANVLRLKNFQGIPCTVALKKTTATGTSTVLQMTDDVGNIVVSDYGQVTQLEVSGSYLVAHSKITKFYLA